VSQEERERERLEAEELGQRVEELLQFFPPPSFRIGSRRRFLLSFRLLFPRCALLSLGVGQGGGQGSHDGLQDQWGGGGACVAMIYIGRLHATYRQEGKKKSHLPWPARDRELHVSGNVSDCCLYDR